MSAAARERPAPSEQDGAERRVVHLTIPAKAEYITLGRLALTGLSKLRPFPDELLADLKLALTEAASNSVRHAYSDPGGSVEITFELRGDRLAIEVSDHGEGFDPEEHDPEEDFADLTEGGLGIAIIRAIADELELGRGADGRGSRLRFVKILSN